MKKNNPKELCQITKEYIDKAIAKSHKRHSISLYLFLLFVIINMLAVLSIAVVPPIKHVLYIVVVFDIVLFLNKFKSIYNTNLVTTIKDIIKILKGK